MVETLDQAARTFNCSVVFVDLVGYSKKSVAEQVAARETFNRLLSETLDLIPDEGRIILDTVDGAALSFLDDPEDALYAGMALRRLATGEGTAPQSEAPANTHITSIRIGINLGPVQIGQDAGGQTTLIGDGINTAEQIMAFAPPGQIAVSKSFYEKVSRLSDEYSNLFRYEGSHTDKHVRDHEIYQLGWSDEALERARASVAARRSPAPAPAPATIGSIPVPAAAPAKGEPLGGLIDFLEDWTKVGFAATVLGAVIVALGILVYMKHVPDSPAPPLVAQQEAPAPAEVPAPLQTDPEPPVKAAPPVTAPVISPPAPVQPVKPAPIAPPPRKEPEKTVADPPPKPKKAAPEPAPPVSQPKTPPRKADPPKETKPAPAPPVSTPPVQPRRETAPAPAATPTRPNAVLGGLVPTSRTPVDFPKEAAREGISSGTVKARLAIDAAGNVTRVDILDARPARVFDRAVRTSLARWTFAPGTDNRSYEIEIDFKR